MSRRQNQSPLRQPEGESAYGQTGAGDAKAPPSAARQWITNEMRRLYNDVVREPLPDSFKHLIDKLDSGEEPEAPKPDRNAAS